MRLVKIDGMYLNIDRVDGVSLGNTTGETHVFVGGSEQPFTVGMNIDEVAAILEAGKEE